MDLRFNGLATSLKSILGLSIVILLSEASLASTMLNVLKVEGKVFRLSEKGTAEGVLKGGEKLNEGDQIRVSSQSRVLLGDEDSKFWAGSNSSLVIRSGEAVENSDKKRKVISLLSGNLRVKIKTGEGANFRSVRSRPLPVFGEPSSSFLMKKKTSHFAFSKVLLG